ncbi:GlsB/YeaQ/YmgE family stress response membrane protein [Actinomycetospora cinnamomea]|nr:GlsB/YeaQ/YmgE family stress response membrane protein [Actinomycetospora cinnamomea]
MRESRAVSTGGVEMGTGIIGAIVLGLIVGALAKLIMPGDDPGGIIVTTLLGIVGAFLGSFLASSVFGVDATGFWNVWTWIFGIIGSLILLGIYRVIVGRRSRVRR